MNIDVYSWVKAVHIISVIAWMAGLLYLPRLFVYHAAEARGSDTAETFKVMERRLLWAIMNPAMIATWISGLWLVHLSGVWPSGWLIAKLVLVVILSAAHMAMSRWRKDLADDRNVRTARFYRIANEVPTVLMIGIVILVVVRPF